MNIGYMCGTLQNHAYSVFLLEDLAENIDGEIYTCIFDNRGWKPDHNNITINSNFAAFTYPFIAANIARKRDLDVFHIQMELTNFGNPFGTFLLPILLIFLRIQGIETVVTIHGPLFASDNVREGLQTLAPSPMFKPLMSSAIRFLFTSIVLLSSSIIVHGEVFKTRLREVYDIPTDNVEVIHHGVPK